MKHNTKKLVLLAMLVTLSYLAVALIRIPVVLFLKYEPKDVVITVGGFLLGPAASATVCFVVALIEMVIISSTGPIGCLMNFISSVCFSCTAALVYRRKRTLGGAIGGLALASGLTVGLMLVWNYLITPLYMGVSREEVAALLLPAFLPFNVLKVGLNSGLTLALYKPLVQALRKARLIESRPGRDPHSRAGACLLGIALVLVCILLIFALQGKI